MIGKARLSAIWAPVVLLDAAVVQNPRRDRCVGHVAVPVALLAGGAAPSLAGADGCVLFGAVAGAGPAVWSGVVMTRIVVAALAIVSTATPAVSVAYLAALGPLDGPRGWLLAVGVAGVVVGASAALHQPAPAMAAEPGTEPAPA